MALLAIAVTGCGSSKTSGTGASTSTNAATSSSAASSTNASLAQAQKVLAFDRAGSGTFTVPSGASPTPAKNKNIWFISIGQTASAIAAMGDALKQAGSHLGWKVNVVDGKFQSSLWQNGIRQAIAAHADGIALGNIDCKPVLAALQDAKRAGIPVVINEGRGCPAGQTDLAHVAQYQTKYNSDGTVAKGVGSFDELNNAWGAIDAWELIEATKAKPKAVLMIETDNGSTLSMAQGAKDVLTGCKSCQIVDTVQFVGTNIGPPLQNKLRQALIQHPEANAVYTNYDDIITSGAMSAVQSTGRPIVVSGNEGNAAVMNLARKGQVIGGSAFNGYLEGYCVADELIYVFASKTPRACGEGTYAWNKANRLAPPGKSFDPGLPVEQAYLKSWGV